MLRLSVLLILGISESFVVFFFVCLHKVLFVFMSVMFFSLPAIGDTIKQY